MLIRNNMPKKAKVKVKKPARDVNVSQTVHVHVTKRRSAPRNANPFQGVRSGNPAHQYITSPPYANQFSSFVPRSGGAPFNLVQESPYAPVRASVIAGARSQIATQSVGVGTDPTFHPRLSPEVLYPRVGAIDLPGSVPRRADGAPSRLVTTTSTGSEEKEGFAPPSITINPYYKQELSNIGFAPLPSTNPSNWTYGNYPAEHFRFDEFHVTNPFSQPSLPATGIAQLPQSALALEYNPEEAEPEMAAAAASTSPPSDALLQEKQRLYRELDRRYQYEPLKVYMRSVGLQPGKQDRSKDALLTRLVEHLSQRK